MAVVHVQTTNPAQAVPGGPSPTVAFASNNAAGNLLVYALAWGGSTTAPTLTGIVDSAGNTIRTAIAQTTYDGGAKAYAVFYVWNCAAGANTITPTFSATPTGWSVLVTEYSGVMSTADPLDAAGSTSDNTGLTTQTANVTTTAANELLLAISLCPLRNRTWSNGTGYTLRGTNGNGAMNEDSTSNAAGSNSASMSLTVANPWALALLAFKLPAAIVVVARRSRKGVRAGSR